jgi:formamidopyrimidine-DNA glycosylase
LKKGGAEKELRFADARKFGFVRLLRTAAEMADLRRGYGPEPFKDLDWSKFKEVLSGSAQPVKIVLMDQEKIAGVGNIYANEALWLAKINPRHPSNKIDDERLKDLYEAVLHVLKLGLKYGGASDNSYVQVHGEKGQYQEHFLVYGRQNQPCARCQTKLVRASLGGRGTFYCPQCQK